MTYKAQSRVCGHSTLFDELPLLPCFVPGCPLPPELRAKAQYFQRVYWKKKKKKKQISVPRRIKLSYGHKRPNSLTSKPWRKDKEKYIQHTMVDTYRFCLPETSDQISRSVGSDSLQPHESQHARPPCPSPTSGVHPDSRPSSQ